MHKTPLCKSTAYLSGVKDEVNDIRKHLSDLKDEIDSLQCIKAKFLLIQSNQKEDCKLIEHNLKSNEINQKRMETELLLQINDLKETLNHEKNLRQMINTVFSSKFENELKSCQERSNDLEVKITYEQDSIKNVVDDNLKEILNLSDDSKKLYTELNNNTITLIKLNEKHNDIENRQRKQEDFISERITNLEQALSRDNENLKNQIYNQWTENQNQRQCLHEQIMSLKAQTSTDLEKNEKVLRKLIQEIHIDIKAEQKIQNQSFQNLCNSLGEEFSKKLDILQKECTNKLSAFDNLQKNQKTLSQQNINLNQKLETTLEKYEVKLDNNVSMLVKLFDEKFNVLANRQKSYENSLKNDCIALVEPKISKVQEDQKNIFQQIMSISNQVIEIDNNLQKNQKLISEETQKLEKKMESICGKFDDKLESNVLMLIKLIEEKCQNIKNQQEIQEQFILEQNSHVEKQISKTNEDLRNEILYHATKSETILKSLSEEFVNLEERTKTTLENFRNDSINSLRKLIYDNHNEAKEQQKLYGELFQNRCEKLEEKLDTNENCLQNKIPNNLTELNKLKEDLNLLSEEESELREKIENEWKNFKEALNSHQIRIELVENKCNKTVEDHQKMEETLAGGIGKLENKIDTMDKNLKKGINQQVKENENRDKSFTEKISILTNGMSTVEYELIGKLGKLIDDNHNSFKDELKIEMELLQEKLSTSENRLQNEITIKLTELGKLKEDLKTCSEKNSKFNEELENEWKNFNEIVNNHLIRIKLVEDQYNKTVEDHQINGESLAAEISKLENKIDTLDKNLKKGINQQVMENVSREKLFTEKISNLTTGLSRVKNELWSNLHKLIDDNHNAIKEQQKNEKELLQNCCEKLEEKLSTNENRLQNEITIKLTELGKLKEDLKIFFESNSKFKEKIENKWNKFNDALSRHLVMIQSLENKFDKTVKDHQRKGEFVAGEISKLENKIDTVDKNLKEEINQQIRENKNKETSFTQDILNLTTGLLRVENQLISSLRKLIDDNHNVIKDQQKNETDLFQNRCTILEEKLSSSVKRLQNEISIKLTELGKLEEDLKIFSVKNSTFKEDVENKWKKFNETVDSRLTKLVEDMCTKIVNNLQDQDPHKDLLEEQEKFRELIKEEFSKINDDERKQELIDKRFSNLGKQIDILTDKVNLIMSNGAQIPEEEGQASGPV